MSPAWWSTIGRPPAGRPRSSPLADRSPWRVRRSTRFGAIVSVNGGAEISSRQGIVRECRRYHPRCRRGAPDRRPRGSARRLFEFRRGRPARPGPRPGSARGLFRRRRRKPGDPDLADPGRGVPGDDPGGGDAASALGLRRLRRFPELFQHRRIQLVQADRNRRRDQPVQRRYPLVTSQGGVVSTAAVSIAAGTTANPTLIEPRVEHSRCSERDGRRRNADSLAAFVPEHAGRPVLQRSRRDRLGPGPDRIRGADRPGRLGDGRGRQDRRRPRRAPCR